MPETAFALACQIRALPPDVRHALEYLVKSHQQAQAAGTPLPPARVLVASFPAARDRSEE